MDYEVTDDELLTRALQGGAADFEPIVSRYMKLLVNIAYRLTDSREDAEDAACDAFVKAHGNIKRCKGALKPWLCAITRNCCIDMLRKRKDVLYIDAEIGDGGETVFAQIPGDTPSPEEAVLEGERRGELEKAVSALKREYREVVSLIAINGLTYEEAAQVLLLPAGTVKSRLNRARAALAKHMEKYYR